MASLLSGNPVCDICGFKRSVGNHSKCSKIRQAKLAGKSHSVLTSAKNSKK